jgi:hypothetical protein
MDSHVRIAPYCIKEASLFIQNGYSPKANVPSSLVCRDFIHKGRANRVSLEGRVKKAFGMKWFVFACVISCGELIEGQIYWNISATARHI